MKKTLLISLFLLSSCSTKSAPAFFPNEYLEKVGRVQADADSSYCESLANSYIKEPNAYGSAAKEGVYGATIGAGTGALTGAIVRGSVGRSLGAGAAVGAIVGIVNELRNSGDHTPTYKRFVEHCLQKKGYQVIGWQTK